MMYKLSKQAFPMLPCASTSFIVSSDLGIRACEQRRLGKYLIHFGTCVCRKATQVGYRACSQSDALCPRI